MKVEQDILISSPISRVFSVFTDLSIAEKEIEGIDKIDILNGPAKMEKGTKWEETRTMFGQSATEIMWVTQIEKEKRYIVEAQSKGNKYRSTYIFNSEGDKTRVKVIFEGFPQSFSAKLMNLISFAMKGSLEKMLHRDMEDLKSVCEDHKQ